MNIMCFMRRKQKLFWRLSPILFIDNEVSEAIPLHSDMFFTHHTRKTLLNSINILIFSLNVREATQIDLVTIFDAILTSRQTREKLQCLYENPMSNNFCKLKLHSKGFYKQILEAVTVLKFLQKLALIRLFCKRYECKLKLHSKGFYLQILGAVTVLKFLQKLASDFPYIYLQFFSGKFLQKNV